MTRMTKGEHLPWGLAPESYPSTSYLLLNLYNMKKLILMIVLILGVGNAQAQTIRNTNNSVLATIDSNGDVRNSNNSLVAKINSNGEIRDSNNHYLGKIDGRTVRNSNNSTLGYIESDGTVRNSSNSLLGRIYDDGSVRDSNNHCIGYAKGVPMKYAAIFFFFNLI